MKFKKRPAIVEAEIFLPDDNKFPFEDEDVIKCGLALEFKHLVADPDDFIYYIETLEGKMIVSPGDWVVKGVEGEFWPCKPGVFVQTYEPAEDN